MPDSGRLRRLATLSNLRMTRLLLLAVVAAFLASVVLASGRLDSGGGLLHLGAVPVEVGARLGALSPRRLVTDLELYRLVAAIFLHGSLIHLAFNALALHQLGTLVEFLVGPRRLLVLFVGTGVAGNGLSAAWRLATGHAEVWSLGASGAICGLLGWVIAALWRRGDPHMARIRTQLITWAAIIFVLGVVTPGIDQAAHAGGFAAGFAALAIIPAGAPALREGRRWTVIAWITLLITAASLLAAPLRTRAGAPAIARMVALSDSDYLRFRSTLQSLADLLADPERDPIRLLGDVHRARTAIAGLALPQGRRDLGQVALDVLAALERDLAGGASGSATPDPADPLRRLLAEIRLRDASVR